MKRTTMFAALTGAAALLVGCSSTSGTATAVSSTSSSSAAASSVSSASSSLASTAPASVNAPASSEPSSSRVAGSAPTTTIGDTSGGLDDQSKLWFTAFCGGVAPIVSITSSMSAAGATTDPAKEEKKIVTLFDTLGSSLSKTAATLKQLPPPTFNGGAVFAAKVVAAFGEAGPLISAQAKKMKTDPASASGSLSGLSDSLSNAVKPMQDLGSLKLTPQTDAAIKKIPACAGVPGLGGG